jgi:hypothetical protein
MNSVLDADIRGSPYVAEELVFAAQALTTDREHSLLSARPKV